jgi:hypothetical protein
VGVAIDIPIKQVSAKQLHTYSRPARRPIEVTNAHTQHTTHNDKITHAHAASRQEKEKEKLLMATTTTTATATTTTTPLPINKAPERQTDRQTERERANE